MKKLSDAFAIIFSNIGLLARKLALTRVKWSFLCFISQRASVITRRKGRISFGKKTCVRPNSELMADGGQIHISSSVFINRNCVICSHEEIIIGEKTTIGPNVCIFDHDHDMNGGFVSKKITIGKKVWIGANATILKGVSLGDGCVVAAGAVVTKDVLPNSVVAGVPATLICD